jgi:addiction module HigA family antidote
MMNRQRKRKPTHAGMFFKSDIFELMGISITKAAEALDVSRKHLSAFVNGDVPCSKDMAQRLSKATETSVASWLNMQTLVDIWEAENNSQVDYESISPLNKLSA